MGVLTVRTTGVPGWHGHGNGLLLMLACRPPPQIVVGAVVNAIGNLLYGFVYLADAWWLMLVAR